MTAVRSVSSAWASSSSVSRRAVSEPDWRSRTMPASSSSRTVATCPPCLGYAPLSTSAESRSAWSVVISVSMSRSRSPLITRGRFERSIPTRWSVTRSCGKLYVRILSARSPAPIIDFRAAESGAEHGQRLRLVLVLALLVLDLDDHARRQVGDPDGGVRRVDRLAAGAGGALDVDPEVLFLVDLDLGLLDLGHDHDRGRRGVD